MIEKELIKIGGTKIAMYMGAKIVAEYQNGQEFDHYLLDFGERKDSYSPDNYCRYHSTNLLRYHESWDWLMPVYRSIKNYLDNIERPSNNHCCHGDLLEVEIHCALTSIDIEKAWQATLDFIDWYNTHEK